MNSSQAELKRNPVRYGTAALTEKNQTIDREIEGRVDYVYGL
ncbi:MAG: hypothetical protein JWR26_3373 [Pedosphaera sp.]|nr:hypothetical protein [Pedosphaera sp.]